MTPGTNHSSVSPLFPTVLSDIPFPVTSLIKLLFCFCLSTWHLPFCVPSHGLAILGHPPPDLSFLLPFPLSMAHSAVMVGYRAPRTDKAAPPIAPPRPNSFPSEIIPLRFHRRRGEKSEKWGQNCLGLGHISDCLCPHCLGPFRFDICLLLGRRGMLVESRRMPMPKGCPPPPPSLTRSSSPGFLFLRPLAIVAPWPNAN